MNDNDWLNDVSQDTGNSLVLGDYLASLASRSPSPGGGSAGALAGALGAALNEMVANLTVGQDGYESVQADCRDWLSGARELRERFMDCMAQDSDAISRLMSVYKLPKDYPNRANTLELCLRQAALASYEIFKLCCPTLDLCRALLDRGNRMLAPDAVSAAQLCRAALCISAVNLRTNTRSMRDRTYAERMNSYVDQYLDKYLNLADRIFDDVFIKAR